MIRIADFLMGENDINILHYLFGKGSTRDCDNERHIIAILNTIIRHATLPLSEAVTKIRSEIATTQVNTVGSDGIFVYEGAHHLAIHYRDNGNDIMIIRCLDIADPETVIGENIDSLVKKERLALGIPLLGH